MEAAGKNWFVDIDGTVYEATTETVDQWIWDGSMLSKHKVSREGVRWLEAGKAPQFAQHFASAQEMNDLMGGEGMGRRPPPGLDEPRAAIAPAIKNQPGMFGARLIAGSAFALVTALLAGYAWAYLISAPKDMAEINNSPEMKALQSKYDTDKGRLDTQKAEADAKSKAIPEPPRLSSGTTGADTLDCSNKDPKNTLICSEGVQKMMREDAKKFADSYNKVKASLPNPAAFNTGTPGVDDLAFTSLNTKFEADKKKIVDDARAAYSKSKFYQTFVLLFIGLAGLNIVKLSFFTGKK